jgi:hypothetical protein
MSIRQFGIITVVVTLLILLSSVYRVGAAPPEPEKEPTVLPDLTPEPAINIRTKLQIYQTSDPELSQSEGRLIKEAPLPSKDEEVPIGALAQQTFNATADATILQGYPTQNFGNTIDMWAGYDDSLNPDGRIVRSLIKFNIASLPPNQVITKATLRVRLVNSWDFPNTYRTITAYRVVANWSESSINWNNAPSYGSAYGSKSIRNDDFIWHEFDVTNLVAAWYSGTYTNYGIMLRGPEFSGPDSSWRGFSTREGPFTPQLVIEYTTVNCPDAFETDNTFTTAKSIPVNGTTQAHNFHLAGDEDWVKFTTTAGKVYTIITSNLGASNDTYMYLYDTNGTTILAQDDDSGPGLGSQIVWTAPSNGTYYVRVRHLINSGGCTGYNYDVAVTESSAQLVPPTPLTALPLSQSQIRLSWPDPNTIETGYKIERSPNGTSGWTQIATVGANVVTYTNAGLTCGTPYFYRVRAYNAVGDSSYSNVANVVTFSCSNNNIYLPFIMKIFVPPTPPPPGSKPKDGHWTGTTSRSQPMSFDVSSGGTVVNNFKLKTNFQVGPCSGTFETTLSSPRPITNNQFSSNSGSFTFSGQFSTSTSASGTYAYVNHFIPGCGIFNQSGTWTANAP